MGVTPVFDGGNGDRPRLVIDLIQNAVRAATCGERPGLLGEGLSNDAIARRLGIVPGTAKAHVGSILSRLGVDYREQAAILAYEAGLIAEA